MQQIILLFGFGLGIFVFSTMSFSIRPSGHFSLRNFVSVSTTYLFEFGGLHKPFERKRNGQNIESYKQYKRTNGMDYRQPMNTTVLFAEYGHSDAVNNYLPNKEREDDIGKIRMFFAKQQLIRELKTPDVPLYKKMENIFNLQNSYFAEDRYNLSPNIFAGGLMKDFEFDS